MPDVAVSPTGPFRFADVLAEARLAARAAPKRARTIAALRAAALGLLEEGGWHDLSVERVSEAAGVSRGAFYQYFRSGEDIALGLAAEFAQLRIARAPRPEGRDPFIVLSTFNRYYVELYRRNAGLMRAQLQLRDALPVFRAQAQADNRDWSERIARGLARRTGAAAGSRAVVLFVHAMQAMVDETLKAIWIDATPALAMFADAPDEVADHLSAIWHRAAYGADPAALGLAEGMRALARPG